MGSNTSSLEKKLEDKKLELAQCNTKLQQFNQFDIEKTIDENDVLKSENNYLKNTLVQESGNALSGLITDYNMLINNHELKNEPLKTFEEEQRKYFKETNFTGNDLKLNNLNRQEPTEVIKEEKKEDIINDGKDITGNQNIKEEPVENINNQETKEIDTTKQDSYKRILKESYNGKINIKSSLSVIQSNTIFMIVILITLCIFIFLLYRLIVNMRKSTKTKKF